MFANEINVFFFSLLAYPKSCMKGLLYTSGAVDHLRIEIGTWHKDGSFTPEATVFSASTLGYGDAILMQLADSKIGDIRITYLSGGNAYSIPLSSILSFG